MGTAKHYQAPEQRPEVENLLAALDTLRIAVTLFDAEGRLVYANAHLKYIFRSFPDVTGLVGLSYEALIRRELAAGEIAPTSLTAGADIFVIQRLAQLQEGRYAPLDLMLADGRIIEIKPRRTPTGQAVLLWSDVTAARHQFARLEEAISLSADAFAFYDSKDHFVTGNTLYAQFAGVSLASIQGRSFAEIMEAAARSGRIQLDVSPEEWIARRMQGHTATASAHTMQTREGAAYLVRDRATPDGGRAVVFTDITDKTRAETALARTESALADQRTKAEEQMSYLSGLTRRLDQASAETASAKTTLLRTMSHELKTPLNAILGFSDLMRTLADNLNPDQIREYAGLVHLGGTNLLKLLNQIMDLTKISAGRYDLRRGPVDAGAVLWNAREAALARAGDRSISIDAADCPPGLLADADESVLSAMVAHLLDNALSFIHPGGAVRLSAARDGDSIRLAIEDNGPGVAAADLSRILQPFEHAGRAENHAKGAGLGLTMVKAFAELHGGTLELASTLGHGFTASIRLPAIIA